ncbi:MAG: PorT family protein [Flammeovirgaceae bacterium]|jgi:hypothetical protein|nr:PorT family protein [Flammeovirgaceae bacterium]
MVRKSISKQLIYAGLMCACMVISYSSHAQYYSNKKFENKNNPGYDERRRFSYGFLIGLHNSSYRVKYSSAYTSQALDTLFSVEPTWTQGFTLGFIVNYRVSEFLDLRITPQVGFYEHQLTYRYTALATNPPDNTQNIETTMVELPFIAKYKSVRRGNIRMYMVGAIKPGLEAGGKKDLDAQQTRLTVREVNLALEGGFGFDLYYPLFKFSPEIRFSRGITNLLKDSANPYGLPLQRISTNTITLYLLFQ